MSVKKSFQVGKQVVCINNNFSNVPPMPRIYYTFPVVGQVYTIRAIHKCDESIRLEEIVNVTFSQHGSGIGEPYFLSGASGH